jgi:RNA polymerase-binding protein DksA
MVPKRKKIKEKTHSMRTKKIRLTIADIAHFKELLLEKRNEILKNVSEIEDEALKKSRHNANADLSRMPIHMAELGTDTYEQEFILGLMDSERNLLHEIDDALERIENKTYGICEGTSGLISKARLEAQPWARYCVEYARMLEKGTIRKEGE